MTSQRRGGLPGGVVPLPPQKIDVELSEVEYRTPLVVLAAHGDVTAIEDLQYRIQQGDLNTLVAAVTFGFSSIVQQCLAVLGPGVADLTSGAHPTVVAIRNNQMLLFEQLWPVALNYDVLMSLIFWLVLRAPQLIPAAIDRFATVEWPEDVTLQYLQRDAIHDALGYALKLNQAALPYFDPLIQTVHREFDESGQPLDLEWRIRNTYENPQMADYIRSRRAQLGVYSVEQGLNTLPGIRRQLSPDSPYEGIDQQYRSTQRRRQNEDEM